MKKFLVLLMTAALMLSMFTFASAEEHIVVSVGVEDQSIGYPEGKNKMDNALVDYIEEKLNCTFDYAFASNDYWTKLNMQIAANDLPDLFLAGPAQIRELCEFGMIQPVGHLYDEYMTQEVNDMLHWGDGSMLVGATYEGEVYGFPNPQDFIASIPELWIRQDWIEKLNLDISPDNFTLADLEALMDAFVNQDPDGNGVNDTYGITFADVNSAEMQVVTHALGLKANFWSPDEEGNYHYSGVDESAKEALKVLQDWYKKGYIAPEYLAVNKAQTIGAGQCGILIGYFWSGGSEPQAAAKANPEAKWELYPLPQNPEGGYNIQRSSNCSSYLVVNSNCEHPEIAAKYMQLWFELWAGELGADFSAMMNSDVNAAQADYKFYAPFWYELPYRNAQITCPLVLKAFESGNEADAAPDTAALRVYQNAKSYLAGEDNWYGFSVYHNFTKAVPVFLKYYGGADGSKYEMDLTTALALDNDLSATNSLLLDLRKEYFNKIIMGADLDSTFAEYVDQWKATGGEDLADYYSDWYKSNYK